jgi:hypothetical protein
MENETITLWAAIREMRETTANNGVFGMVFMSYDQTRQRSKGPVEIQRAKLRPATHADQNKNADYMLNFLDVDNNTPRQMYQVCLMQLNGKRIRLE